MQRWMWAGLIVVLFVSLGACGGGGNGAPPPPAAGVDVGLVPLESVALPLRRRAFQHLEGLRDSQLAPTWKDVRFADQVRKLFRPDVEGVAYYEFQVVRIGAGAGAPSGHVILSTGPHDFPIPHWHFEGIPISYELAERAAQAGEMAVKFYKLDALSYAAENDKGEKVATLGTELARVEGMDPSWLDVQQELHATTWTPDSSTKDDSEASGITGSEKVSGPTPPPELVLTDWGSWDELKLGYAGAYGVLAEGLRRTAAPDWETEQLADEYGEGLGEGDVFRLSLLQDKAPSFKIEGAGASEEYLMAQVEVREGLPALLVLTVLTSVQETEIPFTVSIEYGAATEINKFMIVGPAMLTDLRFKSESAPPGGRESSKIGSGSTETHGWGPWNFYWAGSHADQRRYSQIRSGVAPNTASCWSGCGGTAWAMLFGWADNQAASGNAYWAPRWGLYRANGGMGANAVAPATQDAGVRNMTWEIRNDIGTFCALGSGPTFPWDMGRASRYFASRTGTRLESRCNTLGIHKDDLRNSARDSIIDRGTPAIIGTGWLNHYPLAYGYAWQSRRVRRCNPFCWTRTDVNRAFFVNQGWGGEANGWVTAGTFLYGAIFP